MNERAAKRANGFYVAPTPNGVPDDWPDDWPRPGVSALDLLEPPRRRRRWIVR